MHRVLSVSCRNLDFISIMTYDFHGKWENKTGHNSPLYAHALERDDAATLNTVRCFKDIIYRLGCDRRRASSGVTCVTSKRRDQDSCWFNCTAWSVVWHFLTGFRTEQVSVYLPAKSYLIRVNVTRLVKVDGA